MLLYFTVFISTPSHHEFKIQYHLPISRLSIQTPIGILYILTKLAHTHKAQSHEKPSPQLNLPASRVSRTRSGGSRHHRARGYIDRALAASV